MTAANFDLFEMRRLESLSNTIFGVAMTLLAYDLPKAGQFTSPPGWADLYHLYSGRVVALMPSFIIAGVFWISHHRRLIRQPLCGRGRSCRRAGRGMSGGRPGASSGPAFIRHRDRCARKVKRDRADFVDRARIDMVQFARRLDRRSLAGAIEDIKAEQLFLGLGERAVEQQAITRPA
jgi:hypothetical protein